MIFQRGRARASRALALAAAALYLVVGCADNRGAGELALAGCLVEGEGFLGAKDGLEGEAGWSRRLAGQGFGRCCEGAEGCRWRCLALYYGAQGPEGQGRD